MVLTVLLTAAVFAVDLSVPTGMADAVGYMLVIWASLRFAERRAPIVTALVCTGLTILGGWVSIEKAEIAEPKFIANRVLALIAIWLTAFLGWTRRRVDDEQKQSAAALVASEARIRSIVEAALDCILIMDHDGKIIEFNHAAEKAFGYDRSEVIGREMAELLMPAPSRDRHRRNLNRYATEGEEGSRLGKRLEQSFVRKNGEEFVAEVAMQPVSLAGRPIFAVFLRDITAQRRAEVALKESEALYHSLVETLPLCVARKDADGRFTFVNKAYCEFSGKRRKDFVGKTDFDLYSPELARKYRQDDQRVLQTGELFEDVESHQEADGVLRYVQVLKTPVKDSEGKRVGTQLFFWDVTDRKRAEEVLRRSEEEIRTRNRDLETLLTVVSHDLREPLRAIENFTRLVREGSSSRLDAEGTEYLGWVMQAAQRMDQLLEDVLTLLKAQRSIEPNADVPAAEIVEDVLRQLDGRIRETLATIHVAHDLPVLHVDRPWATQAVFNVVNNALKFTEPGKSPEIEIAAYQTDDDSVRGLVIRDRGPGVPTQYADRIFQLFQRAVGREVEGTGAGLAIVRQVAERHGGKAWVQPREGGGSEFVITFATL